LYLLIFINYFSDILPLNFSSFFSSFISAFNTFSSEIFSKTIDRIKIGENIIFLKPIEPFLMCYVSKGQSYPAMKKLDKISESIKDNEKVLKVLDRAAKASRELHINDLQEEIDSYITYKTWDLLEDLSKAAICCPVPRVSMAC